MRNSVNKTRPIYKVFSQNNFLKASSFYQVPITDGKTPRTIIKSEEEPIPIDLKNNLNQDDLDQELSTNKSHLIPCLASCHHVKRQNKKSVQDANSQQTMKNLKKVNEVVKHKYNNCITTYRDQILNGRDTNYTDRNINGQSNKRLATSIISNRYRQSFVRLFTKPCCNLSRVDDLATNHLKQISVKKKFINEYMRTIINGIPKDDLHPFKVNSKEITVKENLKDSDRQTICNKKIKVSETHFRNCSTKTSESKLISARNDNIQSGNNAKKASSFSGTPAHDQNIKVCETVSIECSTSHAQDDSIIAQPKSYNVKYDFSSNYPINQKIFASISRSSVKDLQDKTDNQMYQKNAIAFEKKEPLNVHKELNLNSSMNSGDNTNQNKNYNITTNERDKRAPNKKLLEPVSKKLATSIEMASDNGTQAVSKVNKFTEVKSVKSNTNNSYGHTELINGSNFLENKTLQNNISQIKEPASRTYMIPTNKTNSELKLDKNQTCEFFTNVAKTQSLNNQTVLCNSLQPSIQRKCQLEKTAKTDVNEFDKKNAKLLDNFTADIERNYKFSLGEHLNPNSSVISGESAKQNEIANIIVDSDKLEDKHQEIKIKAAPKAVTANKQIIKENKTGSPPGLTIEKYTETNVKTECPIGRSKHDNLDQSQVKNLQQSFLNGGGLSQIKTGAKSSKEIITKDSDRNAQTKIAQQEMSNEPYKLEHRLNEKADKSDSKQEDNELEEITTNLELQNQKGDNFVKDLSAKKMQYKEGNNSGKEIVLTDDRNKMKGYNNQQMSNKSECINSNKKGDIDRMTAMLENQRILLETLLAKINASSNMKFTAETQTSKLTDITKTNESNSSGGTNKLMHMMEVSKGSIETYPRIHPRFNDKQCKKPIARQVNSIKKSQHLTKMSHFLNKKSRNLSNSLSSETRQAPGGFHIAVRKLSELSIDKYKDKESYASLLAHYSYNPLKHLLSQCNVNNATKLLNTRNLNSSTQVLPNKSDIHKNQNLNSQNKAESLSVSYVSYLKAKEKKSLNCPHLTKKKSVTVTPRKIICFKDMQNDIKNKITIKNNNFNNLFKRKLNNKRIIKPKYIVNVKIEPPKSEDQLFNGEEINNLKLSKGIIFLSDKPKPKPNPQPNITTEEKKPDYITRLKMKHTIKLEKKENQPMTRNETRQNKSFNDDIIFNFKSNSNHKPSSGASNKNDLTLKMFQSQTSGLWAKKIEFDSWKSPAKITATKPIVKPKKIIKNKKSEVKKNNNAIETIEYLTSLAQKLSNRPINLNNLGLNVIKSTAVPLETKMFTRPKTEIEMDDTLNEYKTSNLASLLTKTLEKIKRENQVNVISLNSHNCLSPPIDEKMMKDDTDQQPLKPSQTAVNDPPVIVVHDSLPVEDPLPTTENYLSLTQNFAQMPLFNIKNKFLSDGINSTMLMMSIKPYFCLRGLSEKNYSSKPTKNTETKRITNKIQKGCGCKLKNSNYYNSSFGTLEFLDPLALQTSFKKFINKIKNKIKTIDHNNKCNCCCVPDFDRMMKAIKSDVTKKSKMGQISKLRKLYQQYIESK